MYGQEWNILFLLNIIAGQAAPPRVVSKRKEEEKRGKR